MAAAQQNLSKMISVQLRNKANEFLNSRKHANNLADILETFEAEIDNYSPVLLTVEVIFIELLRRGDLVQEIVPLKPSDQSAEAEYRRWLRECYETALSRSLECIKRGCMNSRLQALVTVSKLLQAEGKHPLESSSGFYFPSVRLKSIFSVLLDSEQSMSAPIARFQEFTEYRDVQQYGLKVLSSLSYRKSPTSIFIQNYLELLEKLLITEIPIDVKSKLKNNNGDEKEEKILCGSEDKAPGRLCAEPRTHRRALVLLVERLMPLLARPHLATDMLCDSLDAGGPISMLALQGVLELVRHHNISYPDMYDRLYAMFEPEMFATRHKRRLLHLADIFLSSTHLPESLVAAFAKRVSRLALVAGAEDAGALLQLLHNLLLRHPPLKRMICHDDAPAIMSSDPYVMEESCAARSDDVDIGSSQCGVERPVTVRRQRARRVRARRPQSRRGECGCRHYGLAVSVARHYVLALFDSELKKRFKSIEMNFIRPQCMSAPAGERLLHFWQLMA
ncbi:hypothetical protein ACJJTC_015400 [Scirpophaga incertulas]